MSGRLFLFTHIAILGLMANLCLATSAEQVRAELEQLQQMLKKKLINQEDYDKTKAKLLDSLSNPDATIPSNRNTETEQRTKALEEQLRQLQEQEKAKAVEQERQQLVLAINQPHGRAAGLFGQFEAGPDTVTYRHRFHGEYRDWKESTRSGVTVTRGSDTDYVSLWRKPGEVKVELRPSERAGIFGVNRRTVYELVLIGGAREGNARLPSKENEFCVDYQMEQKDAPQAFEELLRKFFQTYVK